MITRTSIHPRHALIAPDGHVPSAFPQWSGTTAIVLISPAMGAKLSHLLVTFDDPHGAAFFPPDEHEHVIYVEYGTIEAAWNGGTTSLGRGGFLFTPAGTNLVLHGTVGARLSVFRKVFAPISGIATPEVLHGNAADIPAGPFLGDERARLQTLLPADVRFDLAVNVFTYQPGACLPFVETHIMEHGLLMLSGRGIYRLENSWYPVEAGDAIWMAPYCPQWFAAIGDQPASYLYYKDIHRLP